MSCDDQPRQLPLRGLHEKAGATFGGFAGWSMPISYPAGVMKEHLHTREHAGLFDISHMKLIAVEGPQAADLLARLCPLDPLALANGGAKYTFFLNDKAGVIDDLIVTRLGPERFMVVANAGNAARDITHLRDHAGAFDCAVEPLDRVFLALQGPDAADLMVQAGFDLDHLRFMQGAEPRPGWFASRSGYTGEDGFEIGMPAAEAADVAERLLADERCQWVGLAARDSLRLEAGLCLHGHDIDETTTPPEAGLMWAVSKPVREARRFIGADALLEAAAAGPKRRRVGLKPDGRQPVRDGVELFDVTGAPAGRVTSGGFGPSVGHPVAMGYVGADLAAAGTRLEAEVRGRRLPVSVAPLPFVQPRSRKG
ncbi:MAG: glycine cleavage system aminomethyltransferase GcvT [Rhizobiaceae bacterium]